LAPLPTSVASEHLFSTAGDIYNECLAPEQAEAVLFAKKNFSLVGGKLPLDYGAHNML